MNDPRSALRQLGLTSQEVDTFLLLLELGSAPVSTIALRGHMKRTNLYNILTKLAEKGLVTEFSRGRVRYFQATEPKRLLTLQEQQKKKLEQSILNLRDMLPLLENFQHPSLTKPRVKFFQGKEEVTSLLNQILHNESFDCYFNPATAFDMIPDEVESFLENSKKQKLHIRELIVDGPMTKSYIKKIKNPHHQWKVLPKWCSFQTDNFVFGDSVAFVSYGAEWIAVLIESPLIAQTQKMAFDLMWKAVK